MKGWIKNRVTHELVPITIHGMTRSFTMKHLVLYSGGRLDKATPHWLPYKMLSPLCGDYWLEGGQLKEEWYKLTGVNIPRLYTLGFPHNNCGGFCVKAGLRHFKHLLKVLPDVYRHHEEMEQQFRVWIDKDVAILRLQRKNDRRPITLRELRESIEKGIETDDGYEDFGGCACVLI